MVSESEQLTQVAPPFDLESDQGKRVSLDVLMSAGKWLVLYFYPKDNTPGCTRQAQAFTEAGDALAQLDAVVVGVSKDSVKSHCNFREKHRIAFSLLSDPALETHKAYGAWGVKMMYGKKVEGTIRSTFIISPRGLVVRSWKAVKVDGHVDAVVAALAEFQAKREREKSARK